MFKTIFENAGNGNIRAIIIEIEAETGYRSVLDIAEYDGFSEKVVEKLAKFLMKRHDINIEELSS
jgi:DNA uptake protein ComE-like DNA-binding protein